MAPENSFERLTAGRIVGYGYRFIGEVALVYEKQREEIEIETLAPVVVRPETESQYLMRGEFEVEPGRGVSNAVPELKWKSNHLHRPSRPLATSVERSKTASGHRF